MPLARVPDVVIAANKPFVKVTWDDAEDPSDGKTWLDAEDVESFSTHNCTVVSVGYLVSKTSKYVTLAADWIEELGHYGRVTKIPAGMVTEIVTLLEGGISE